MDGDTESTNTSIEDKTEDFCDNPTRDALAEGLMCLLKPTIDALDERVRATRQVVRVWIDLFDARNSSFRTLRVDFFLIHIYRLFNYVEYNIIILNDLQNKSS